MNRLLALLLASTALLAPEGEGAGGGGAGEGDSAAAAAAAAAAAGAGGSTVEIPKGLDAKYWDEAAKAPKWEDLLRDTAADRSFRTENEALVTEARKRLEGVPAKPEDYKAELPAAFKKPEGFEFAVDPKDPLLAEAQAFAKKHGLSQEAFSELIGMRAALEAESFQTLQAGDAKEMEKLGTQAPARIKAVGEFLVAELGEDVGSQLAGVLFTAAQFEGMEKLIAKAKGASGNGYKGGGGGGGKPQLTEEQWARMSETDRINYARDNSPAPKKAAA